MEKLSIKDAVDIFYKQTTIIDSLWTVYVAATFAAGGFSALKGDHGTIYIVASALTVAFAAFTIGNWNMLKSQIQCRYNLRLQIIARLDALPEDKRPAFTASVRQIARGASTVLSGAIVHGTIDFCVVVAIWGRAIWLAHQPVATVLAGG